MPVAHIVPGPHGTVGEKGQRLNAKKLKIMSGILAFSI